MKSKSRPPVSIVKIPKNRIDNYIKHFWGSAETIFVAVDVIKLHAKGGKDTRNLFITAGAIYFFRTRFGSIGIAAHKTVIDLTKVSFIEPDTLILQFNGEKQIAFRSEDSRDIGAILLMQHACNYYQVPNANKLKVESSPPDALIYECCPVRPVNALQTRLVTTSHYYRTPFPQQCVKLYKDWDQNPKSGQLIIDDTFAVKGAAISISHAIAWDSDIKTLVLHNFAPESLSKVLTLIFEQSFSIQKIIIENYSLKYEIPFKLISTNETSISSLIFRELDSSIILGILRGLFEFNGRFKMIGFTSVNLTINEWNETFTLISKHPCFLKLSHIRIDDLIVETFPVKQLSSLLQKIRVLNHITFAKPRSDVTEILSHLLSSVPSLKHIEFFQSRFRKQIFSKIVPNDLTLLDISGANLTPEFFVSLITVLLGRVRAKPFVLNISNLVEGIKTVDLFNPLMEKQLYPVLCEFSWNNNLITSIDFQPFLKFLVSQRKSLQYLDLSGCVRDDAGQILSPLFELIKQSSIQGIDISSDKQRNNSIHFIRFIQNLSNLTNFKSFTLSNVILGEEGKKAIINLIKSCINLNEISLDLIGLQSQEEFCEFYDNICSFDTLKAIGSPRKEQLKLGIVKDKLNSDVKSTLLLLKKKKVPLTSYGRLLQYEKTEYDNFEGNKNNLIPKTKSNPLEELQILIDEMVNTICGDDKSEISPYETALMLLNNFKTSSTSISNNYISKKKIGSLF